MAAFPELGFKILNKKQLDFVFVEILYHERLSIFIVKLKPGLHIVRRIVRLQLHGAIYRLDSFVLMLLYCANLKAIRYESTSLNRIVADKSHRVIVA